jgi:hypothetical protein
MGIKVREYDYWMLIKEDDKGYVWYLSKSKKLTKKVRVYTGDEDYPMYAEAKMTEEEINSFDIEALWQEKFGSFNKNKINWYKGPIDEEYEARLTELEKSIYLEEKGFGKQKNK